MIEVAPSALEAPPDYSKAFDERVASLGERIGRALDVGVEIDRDMNYSASQRVIILFDDEGDLLPARSEDATFRLVVFISSKGPYYTVRVWTLRAAGEGFRELGLVRAGNYWAPDDGPFPTNLERSLRRVERVLRSASLDSIDPAILEKVVGAHFTELDGKPATVFEVLFSEVHG